MKRIFLTAAAASALAVGAPALALAFARKGRCWWFWACGAVPVVAFVVFVLMFKWQAYHSRLHMPILLLAAPWVAAVLGAGRPRPAGLAFGALALAALVPTILWNHSRPLIGEDSVLTDSPWERMYWSTPELRGSSRGAAEFVSIEVELVVDGGSRARSGVFLAREKFNQRTGTEVQSEVTVSRHPDGNLQTRVLQRSQDDADTPFVDWPAVDWPAGEPMTVRIEREVPPGSCSRSISL